MKALEALEIARVWRVSTIHIQGEDARQLEQCRDRAVAQHADGWLITLPDAAEVPTNWLGRTWTPAMTHLLSIALSHGVEYVLLERNGPIYDFLQQYHW